jgi:hypothetical protein
VPRVCSERQTKERSTGDGVVAFLMLCPTVGAKAMMWKLLYLVLHWRVGYVDEMRSEY